MSLNLLVWLLTPVLLPLLTQSKPLCDASCTKCLTSSDFELGTYRILESGKYCLSQDIILNPLSGGIYSPNSNFNWFPNDPSLYEGCDAFENGAFALGFFSAITIETDNVEIDLNSFEISQHPYFYIQQRFFSIIEIGKSPFPKGFGPTDFGKLSAVSNIYIHSGTLGLSSHHGIHSNEANDVTIANLKIYNFEVGGIQFNGFTNIILRNIEIGPSAENVLPSGYYSNAKFLSLAFHKLLSEMGSEFVAENEIISFSGNRQISLQEIYSNLLSSMDIAFRHFINKTSINDVSNPLYSASIDLFGNPSLLPDGASLYGLVLHSRNIAIFGFGQFENDPIGDGERVLIENVDIHNLKLNVNEIPTVYFDKCTNTNPDLKTVTPVKGPFGDVMDIRQMVGDNKRYNIDSGAFTHLKYVGNPLSDAQIALAIYGKDYNGLDYGSSMNSVFLQWALDGNGNDEFEYLPSCVSFICNGDIMQHTNKGIIGARFDLIEDVIISKIQITNLYNQSPLSSYACFNYSGEHDGGSQGQLDNEGATGTHATGMSVFGGDVLFQGQNTINTIKSDYGSSFGLHLMDNAVITMDDKIKSKIQISASIKAGTLINTKELIHLIDTKQFPYPNNFEQCNIKINENDNVELIPNPPNGVNRIECQENDMVEMYNHFSMGENFDVVSLPDEGYDNNEGYNAEVSFLKSLMANIWVVVVVFISSGLLLFYCYYVMKKETKKETRKGTSIDSYALP